MDTRTTETLQPETASTAAGRELAIDTSGELSEEQLGDVVGGLAIDRTVDADYAWW